jgi:hypothetical protein
MVIQKVKLVDQFKDMVNIYVFTRKGFGNATIERNFSEKYLKTMNKNIKAIEGKIFVRTTKGIELLPTYQTSQGLWVLKQKNLK